MGDEEFEAKRSADDGKKKRGVRGPCFIAGTDASELSVNTVGSSLKREHPMGDITYPVVSWVQDVIESAGLFCAHPGDACGDAHADQLSRVKCSHRLMALVTEEGKKEYASQDGESKKGFNSDTIRSCNATQTLSCANFRDEVLHIFRQRHCGGMVLEADDGRYGRKSMNVIRTFVRALVRGGAMVDGKVVSYGAPAPAPVAMPAPAPAPVAMPAPAPAPSLHGCRWPDPSPPASKRLCTNGAGSGTGEAGNYPVSSDVVSALLSMSHFKQ
jgi:hypothetical protein